MISFIELELLNSYQFPSLLHSHNIIQMLVLRIRTEQTRVDIATKQFRHINQSFLLKYYSNSKKYKHNVLKEISAYNFSFFYSTNTKLGSSGGCSFASQMKKSLVKETILAKCIHAVWSIIIKPLSHFRMLRANM